MSIALLKPDGRPVPVLSWSPNARRRIEHRRDLMFRQIGTDEPLIEETAPQAVFNRPIVAVSWRKPLRIDEVNQLAPTPEVKQRPGRA